MKTSAAFAVAAAQLISAHTTFQSIVVDGADAGQHVGVQTPSNGNNPIYDVTSSSMNCNGGTTAAEFVSVAAGSKIGLQWHHNDPMTTSGDNDEPIAASHKGPVMVYMAKADTNGEGAVWTKIYEDGLTGGVWGVDNFIANKGLIEVTLPNLADGEYLIRPEMIGLHEATREEGAQFYNGCGQLKISGGSVELPSSGTDMTKAYSASEAGVLVDIYNSPTSYAIPGPAVWDGASSGSGSGSGSTPATPTTSTPPMVTSAAPSAPASSTPVSSAAPSSPAYSAPAYSAPAYSAPAYSAPAASATPSSPVPSAAPVYPADGSSGSGSSLPKKFTVDQFITWLQSQTGSSAKARRHARAFDI